jgi:hypothetical protein
MLPTRPLVDQAALKSVFRKVHALGRPRVVGPRLLSLNQVLHDPQTAWERLALDWYGEGEQSLELSAGTAC